MIIGVEMKEILINQDENHNKFWCISFDKNDNTVTVKYGRIGTSGQTQHKSFRNSSEAVSHFNRRYDRSLSSKLAKGYRRVTKHELAKLEVEATILGTRNKINYFDWIEISHKIGLPNAETLLIFKIIDANRLMCPECVPSMSLRCAINGEERLFILTGDEAYEGIAENREFKMSQLSDAERLVASISLSDYSMLSVPTKKIQSGPAKDMVDKLEKALGNRWAQD